MKRLIASILAIASFGSLAVIGCSSDPSSTTSSSSSSSSGAPPTSISLDDLSAKMAVTFCSLLFSCCTTAEIDTLSTTKLGGQLTTEAQCPPVIKPDFDKEASDIKAAVDAGRVKYDGAKAGTCLDKILTQCVDTVSLPLTNPLCQGTLTGLVQTGGDCMRDYECAVANSFCAFSGMDAKCTVVPKEGEACPDFVCADGLDCSSMTQVCKKPVADGQMCADNLCATGFCDPNTSVCAPKKPLGNMCSFAAECQDGYCDEATKVCFALKAHGDACVNDEECKDGVCEDNKCLVLPVCDGK